MLENKDSSPPITLESDDLETIIPIHDQILVLPDQPKEKNETGYYSSR